MNAIFLLSDHKYLPLTLNTIRSFKKNNTWFSGDINILFCEDKLPNDKHEDYNFIKIDYNAYNTKHFTLDKLINFLKIPLEKFKTIYKIEVFKHHDKYEKILFIDSDCIVRKSVRSLFDQSDSYIYRYDNALTNSGVFFSVKNLNSYDLLRTKLVDMSKFVVEEFIFSKNLKSFKDLDPNYNDFGLTKETVIQHLQFVELDQVLELQNEYNLL